MSKTLGNILESALFPITIIDRRAGEIIAGVTLEVAGAITGNPLLAAAGAFELSRGLAPKSPKPVTAEPAEKPDHCDPFDTLMGLGRGDEQDFGVISGFGVGRRGRDDLFEIDRFAPVIERRVQ